MVILASTLTLRQSENLINHSNPSDTRKIIFQVIQPHSSKMNTLKENWFSEDCQMWPGGTFSFEVKEVLHKEKSQYQDILVLDTTAHGKVLVLDGIVQCSERDEFSYQVHNFHLCTLQEY